jgi:hypothetical protein
MNARRLGGLAKQVLFGLLHRWFPFVSIEDGDPLRRNINNEMSRMVANFQTVTKANIDTGADIELVAENGAILLIQVKSFALKRVSEARKTALWDLLAMFSGIGVLILVSQFGNSLPALLVVPILLFGYIVIIKPQMLSRARLWSNLAGLSVRSLTGIATLLAGPRRLALRQEWTAHLAGESGHDPASWQKVGQAAGFLVSAVRCRCSDAADAAWAPVDAILRSRTLSNLFVLIPTVAAGYLVLRHEGTLGVVISAENIIAIAGVLYGLIRTGRWWRNIKPSEPKARRARK